MKNNPRPVEIAAAILVAIVSALSTVSGLRALSRPDHLETRVAAIRADTAEAQEHFAQRPVRGAVFYGDCAGPTAGAPDKVRQDLTALAAAAHLESPRIEIRPAVTPSPPGLEAFDVRFEAAGPYEGALGLLAATTASRPTLFLDTADLDAKVTAVALRFKGRVYCVSPH